MAEYGLQDPSLLHDKCFIGDWVEAESGEQLAVDNPATGELITSLPCMDARDTERAVDLAAKRWPVWRATPINERSAIMRRMADLMQLHIDDVSRILTMEQGKPLFESKGELARCVDFLDFYAEEIKRPAGRLMPPLPGGQRALITHEPVGVGAIITPWNFPALMILRDLAPALAAGCPVVVKPSGLTPLTALALVDLSLKAGVPPGVISVVVGARGSGAEIGRVLTEHPKVRKISFTGSTAVGKLLARQAMSTVKRLGLELGGNAPFIIFDDADLDAAVDGLIASKFRNAGQTCVTTNRIYVQDAVHDEVVERVAARSDQLKVGNGLDDGIQMGPLVMSSSIAEVERHIRDAISKGAKVVTGGTRDPQGPNFFKPTVLSDVEAGMLPFECEIFGPVAPICRFGSEEEVIGLANDTPFGLAAYFYSEGTARCWRVAEALEAGIVCENTVAFATPSAPFGGYKESGVGRVGGQEGLEEWQETKYRCIGGLS